MTSSRKNSYKTYPCDICNSTDIVSIPSLRVYTNSDQIFTCKNCGFVFVPNRRSSEEIAKSWSDEIFMTAENPSEKHETFTAVRPAIKARLMNVVETINQELGLENKYLCDIGAGEGVFLNIIKKLYPQTNLFGIEPSKINCELLEKNKIENFVGTLQDFHKAEIDKPKFDIITMSWTLECTPSCVETMDMVYDLLKPDGFVVISTGSRILVPFKKPLQFYVGNEMQDTHSFRFSFNSLSNLMNITGFKPTFHNRFIDTDILCMIGQRKNKVSKENIKLLKDDYKTILSFFERWAKESKDHYSNWIDE